MKTLITAALLALFSVAAFAADASGKWSGSFAPEGQNPSSAFVILKANGATLTGSGGPDEGEQWPIQEGKVEGNKISGQVTSPDGVIYKLTLTLDGDKLTGEVTATREGQTMKAKIELNRVKS